MTFKIGDRVRYCGPCAQGGKSDFGTIVARDSGRRGCWWVEQTAAQKDQSKGRFPDQHETTTARLCCCQCDN